MKFPLLNQKVNNNRLIYVDNAATTQKPIEVIDAITTYYLTQNANVHRGIHTLSEQATSAYEQVRKETAQFINAKPHEIVFTKGTTESLNLLAFGLDLKKGDEVLITEMEHHANIVPWLELKKRKGIVVKYIPLKNFELDLSTIEKLITKKTKVVSITHISNVLGGINPIEHITKSAHKKGAIVIIDGAQAIAHLPIDVKKIDCDAYVFSTHKMYGPTGLGVLYAQQSLLEQLHPLNYGGNMIDTVEQQDYTLNDIPYRFEAGTPAIAEVIAFGTTLKFMKKERKQIEQEKKLVEYTYKQLTAIPTITLYGPKEKRTGVFSFNIQGIHPHDLATFLNKEGIAIRSGHHCAQPLMAVLNIKGCARVSLAVYNTKKDIDQLVSALKKIQQKLVTV